MRKYFLLIVLAIAVSFVNVSMWNNVYAAGGPDVCEKHPDQPGCQGGGSGGSAKIERGAVDVDNNNMNINSNKNTNTNMNVNSNKNTNTNTNMNVNSNKNTNTNTNNNTNIQGQVQGQDQNQKQNQDQKQNQNQTATASANNNGNKQNTSVVIEGDKYEAAKMHISGPALMKSDTKFNQGARFAGRNYGSVWSKVMLLTLKQSQMLSKNSSDAKVEISVFVDKPYRTSSIHKGASGDFIGTIYVYPDGEDVTIAAMEGKAAETAMKLGATHMHQVFLGYGDIADGSSWSLGVGGGASIITQGDAVAIAPNGGTGIGGAKATNYSLPEMVFELYSNEAILNLKDIKKKQTGNHTSYGSQSNR